MKHSSFILPLVGATFLSFAVATGQQTSATGNTQVESKKQPTTMTSSPVQKKGHKATVGKKTTVKSRASRRQPAKNTVAVVKRTALKKGKSTASNTSNKRATTLPVKGATKTSSKLTGHTAQVKTVRQKGSPDKIQHERHGMKKHSSVKSKGTKS